MPNLLKECMKLDRIFEGGGGGDGVQIKNLTCTWDGYEYFLEQHIGLVYQLAFQCIFKKLVSYSFVNKGCQTRKTMKDLIYSIQELPVYKKSRVFISILTSS